MSAYLTLCLTCILLVSTQCAEAFLKMIRDVQADWKLQAEAQDEVERLLRAS